MATTGTDLITTLAQRLRDADSTAHSRDLLLRILSQSQRAINFHDRVRRQTTVSFTTSVGRTLYRTSEIAADIARIERIRVFDRTLHEVNWHELKDSSPTWYRDVAGAPHTWARIGGTLWALTPGSWDPRAIEVVYVIITADVVDDATAIDLPDEFVPMLLDLAEGIMLMKARLFAQMDGALRRLGAMVPLTPKAGVPVITPNV